MKLFSLMLLLTVFTHPAFAQLDPTSGKEGEVLDQAICSEIINSADVSIQGTLSTATQILKNGDPARHSDNFKLLPGDRKEFCALGPFFEGRRLELVVRTMFPLFKCKTKIDRKITLTSTIQEDGSRKYSANCR